RGLSVGSVIDIETAVLDGMARFATKKHGKYIITEITHYAKEAHYYTNSFVALPADIGSLPEPEVALPIAHTQMARVLSNEDPQQKGRVQVQMNWQSGEMKTAWIRVLTPDGGSSDQISTNRGFVFIPEKDDQVLLGFRFNDPNRPFVLGSLFNGQTGAGGGSENTQKSIITRSGHMIAFNDTHKAESITITDKNNNIIFIDTANSSIRISAPENISISAKNIDITASENLTASAGKSMGINAGDDITIGAGDDTTITAGEDLSIMAKNITEQASDRFTTESDSLETHAKDITSNSTQGKIDLHSKEDIKNNSSKKVNLF
ncbi:phage baseplate assembly protein V, partial [Mariniflexile ostreae]